MMKKLLIAVLIIMSLILLSACGNYVYDSPRSEGIGHIRELETVYIGAMLPIDSESSEEALHMQAAMEVAVDIINNPHPLEWDLAAAEGLANYGHAQVELVMRGCGATIDESKIIATDLIDLGLPLLVGAYHNDFTAAVAQVCLAEQVPMICGSAKAQELTDGSFDFAPYFNRIGPGPAEETAFFLDYINQLNITANAGIKKIAVAYINNEYGSSSAEILRQALEKTDLELVAFISYELGDEDLVEEAANLLANEPDVLVQISSTDDLSAFANIYAKASYQPQLVLCYSGGFQRSAFAAVVQELAVDYYQGLMVCPDRLYRSGADAPDSKQQAGEIFSYINNLYHEKTGRDMDNAALLEFASVIIAAQAVDMAATTDRATLNTLLKTKEFPAPYLYSGAVSFAENGQNQLMPSYIAEIVGSRYVYKYQ
jgi:branched-chain amino acid transport system substrate-binding protein